MAKDGGVIPEQENEKERVEPRIVRPARVLLSWEAPERIFKKHSPEYYRKMAVIIIFFAFLLLLIKEFLLIAVLAIVFFVVYTFHTVPPGKVKHEITTHGVNYASSHLYKWDDLLNFFIEEKDGVKVLTINTKDPLPGRIFLLLNPKLSQDTVTKVINEYISVTDIPKKSVIEELVAKITSKFSI